MNAERSAPQDAAPLIELHGVSRLFDDEAGGAPVEALAEVSLTIHAGEFVAVVGKSGSGKSTLLHILGCLDRPTGGVYRFAGAEPGNMSGAARARLRRDMFGFVFQDYSLLDELSACANVELPAKYAGVARARCRARALKLLDSLGLAARADHRPAELSGGEQQRVAVARALMNGGRVVLADEPTGALDTAAGAELVERLAGLAKSGHTVVVATHDAQVAARAPRRIEISEGRIVNDSEPPAGGHSAWSGDALPARRGFERCAGVLVDGWSALATAWRHRRLGTTLSAGSVAVGVWCLLVLLGLVGGGLREGLDAAILHMGADTIHLERAFADDAAPARFDLADVRAIRAMPNIREVQVHTGRRLPVQAQGVETLEVRVEATDANVSVRDGWPLASGRFHTAKDSEAVASVAVIGTDLGAALFPAADDPVGQQFVIDGQPFAVIGVLTPREAGFLQSEAMASLYDTAVYLPLATGRALLFGDASLNIAVRVANPARLEETARSLHALLFRRHGADTFRLHTRSGSMGEWPRVQHTMQAAGVAVGVILVVLGGFGVFAVTVISVRSRRREIGIRLAAGAVPNDILRQFLGEASAVGLAGGVLGVLASAATLYAIGQIPAPVELAPWHVVVALAGAATLAMLFSLPPALRAAKMDPLAVLATE